MLIKNKCRNLKELLLFYIFIDNDCQFAKAGGKMNKKTGQYFLTISK